jgi:glyoxylase-like metal-dependent hydrolase (beta-lactamase superfamily II)
MKKTVILLLFVFHFCSYAQENEKNIKVDAVKLAENIYKLIITVDYDVNSVAVIGENRAFLLDAGFIESAKAIKAKLAELGAEEIRLMLNTHIHGDHTGGNLSLGKDITVISHTNTRKRLSKDEIRNGEIFNKAVRPDYLPDITIDDPSTIFFADEEIRLLPLIDGHTDTDIIVHLVNSKILYLGDLLFSDTYPFVDLNRGGNPAKYAECIKVIIDKFPEDAKIIAGHGRDYTMNELKEYHKMLIETIEAVRTALKNGKDLEEMKKADILKDWNSWSHETEPLCQADFWIGTIYKSLTKK